MKVNLIPTATEDMKDGVSYVCINNEWLKREVIQDDEKAIQD